MAWRSLRSLDASLPSVAQHDEHLRPYFRRYVVSSCSWRLCGRAAKGPQPRLPVGGFGMREKRGGLLSVIHGPTFDFHKHFISFWLIRSDYSY